VREAYSSGMPRAEHPQACRSRAGRGGSVKGTFRIMTTGAARRTGVLGL
jgi:hypothetical protein